ncbi:hypothetical protein HPB48_022931 [Haemaphysalis longicornis]|uniref:Chitin-binding type-2 domain-containing protein n=1 Tax=Haemaphysalis longicornis TaxID=44386 RepID=A0A9J6GBR7_HAELO|nr:hypothetical protein HPB48_022931 [Haemaphysalis longicornis]
MKCGAASQRLHDALFATHSGVYNEVSFLAQRSKRQAYELPAGSELLLYAPLSTSFRCQGEGYYADVQNNCQVYHVCHQVTRPDGAADFQHYSFMCGNQTVFDQLSLTCAFPEDGRAVQQCA